MNWFTEFGLSWMQQETMCILIWVLLGSIAFCFLVGEISRNNSQMDKLWSILPIVYSLIIMFESHFNWRIIVIAAIITFWGVRLTINFAKKGAYSIKFWSGEEDYRWKYLRSKKPFNNKFVWGVFDLLFISTFQNVLVLFITLPAVAIMDSESAFNIFDALGIIISVGAIIYELIADKQQMKFQTTKWSMIKEGKKLEELPMPYCLGFNTTGLWNRSRHPNYIGEQLTWFGIYLFTLMPVAIFNWTGIGFILLVLVFIGSSRLAESISSSKYPLYKDYKKKVFKYLPIKKYNK